MKRLVIELNDFASHRVNELSMALKLSRRQVVHKAIFELSGDGDKPLENLMGDEDAKKEDGKHE